MPLSHLQQIIYVKWYLTPFQSRELNKWYLARRMLFQKQGSLPGIYIYIYIYIYTYIYSDYIFNRAATIARMISLVGVGRQLNIMILCAMRVNKNIEIIEVTMIVLSVKPISKDPWKTPLLWRHNGRDGISNHQPRDCLLNRLFRRRSTKSSKPCVTGLCAGNSPVTDEFPAQMASNAENVCIWWRHHAKHCQDPWHHGTTSQLWYLTCPLNPTFCIVHFKDIKLFVSTNYPSLKLQLYLLSPFHKSIAKCIVANNISFENVAHLHKFWCL